MLKQAQIEVACVLKGLAEDGEVRLQDGRRLLSHTRYAAEVCLIRFNYAKIMAIDSFVSRSVLLN